jgi:superfamily I DNA/RNA helicase
VYLSKYYTYGIYHSEFISYLNNTLKQANITKVYNSLIVPLKQYFKLSNFTIKDLNSKIETILNTQFNLMQFTDDNNITYLNNESNVYIQLTSDQIYKARITMDSIYDSYNTDYSFKCLLEIEKFQEIINSLSLTQVEKDSNNTDCILLSTIHGFKGLESELVYYFNLSSLSPFYKQDKLNDLCVMYVACTRAIQELVITTSLNLRTFDRSYRVAHQNPYLEYYLDCVKNVSKT